MSLSHPDRTDTSGLSAPTAARRRAENEKGLACLLTCTPVVGNDGIQINKSNPHARLGGCCRRAIVFPIITLDCTVAGTMFAHMDSSDTDTAFAYSFSYSVRRAKATTTFRGSSSIGLHAVQFFVGTLCNDT
eukprot:7377741-Prymnesium_polylepis.1